MLDDPISRTCTNVSASSGTASPLVDGVAESVELVSRRRLLGSYYTPDRVASILSDWAITDACRTALDPSFGGCAFMAAAAESLRARGRVEPGAAVFGVDIDRRCVEYVKNDTRLREENVIVGDFLSLDPAEVSGYPFSVILGNPPFVRRHWMNESSRRNAFGVAAAFRETLPRTASLWAYFVLHSTEFLAPGGRLAMLVPEAVLQARYGETVRETLRSRFARTRLIHLRERLFERTAEAVVVIAAEGHGVAGKVHTAAVDSVSALESALCEKGPRARGATLENGRRVPASTLEILRRIEESERTVRLGKFARTSLGVVTGANRHFVRSRTDLDGFEVPGHARRPIVAKASRLAGLIFRRSDHDRAVTEDERAFLVRPGPSMDDHPGILRWREEGETAGVDEGYKCAARHPWYRTPLPPAPDAFVVPMGADGPRLVLNRSTSRCTNTLYALFWSGNGKDLAARVAVSFLTTPVAVWCELNGRRYGEGLLKLDLSAVHRLPVLPCRVTGHVLAELDRLLREGRTTEARARADETVPAGKKGIDKTDMEQLGRALLDLREHRRPSRLR